jgi:hypothetical protein
MGNETAWQESATNDRFAGKTVIVTGITSPRSTKWTTP